MFRQQVYVEINPETGIPIRIIKHSKAAGELPIGRLATMARSVAVGYIRTQVIDRARRGNLIKCEFCGAIITGITGEMHEVVPKGKGGEVSLDNCRFICNDCHTGKPDSEHGDRRWQTSRNSKQQPTPPKDTL